MNAQARQMVNDLIAATNADRQGWREFAKDSFHAYGGNLMMSLDGSRLSIWAAGDRVSINLDAPSRTVLSGAVIANILREKTRSLDGLTAEVVKLGRKRPLALNASPNFAAAAGRLVSEATKKTRTGALKWRRTLWNEEAYTTHIDGYELALKVKGGLAFAPFGSDKQRASALTDALFADDNTCRSLLRAVQRQVSQRVVREAISELGA